MNPLTFWLLYFAAGFSTLCIFACFSSLLDSEEAEEIVVAIATFLAWPLAWLIVAIYWAGMLLIITSSFIGYKLRKLFRVR